MYTYPFVLLRAIGMWQPKSWSSSYQLHLYRAHTVVILTISLSFILSQILDLVLVADNVQEIMENLMLLTTTMNIAQKVNCFLSKRSQIQQLIGMFNEEISRAENETEAAIQKRFDDESRANARKLFVLYGTTLSSFIYLPYFIQPMEERLLVFRCWLPFSLEPLLNYNLAYLHQACAATITTIVGDAAEAIVSGFMIQICAQFAILEERFVQLPKTMKSLKDAGLNDRELLVEEKRMFERLVKHHWHIFEMSRLFNDTFNFVILCQFMASTAVLCVTIYILALSETFNTDFITLILYQNAMLLQIFLYTWYGNEVTLTSVEFGCKLLRIEWSVLSSKGIKSLMIIFQRTTRPIKIHCGHIIALSNVAFTSIVKTSYSVYNVLSV